MKLLNLINALKKMYKAGGDKDVTAVAIKGDEVILGYHETSRLGAKFAPDQEKQISNLSSDSLPASDE